jgi:transcriptional/translational regulatory protein YebC/TACO1
MEMMSDMSIERALRKAESELEAWEYEYKIYGVSGTLIRKKADQAEHAHSDLTKDINDRLREMERR